MTGTAYVVHAKSTECHHCTLTHLTTHAFVHAFSFDDSTNKKIGRWDKTNPEKIHKDKLFEIATWCLKFAVGLKINTGS